MLSRQLAEILVGQCLCHLYPQSPAQIIIIINSFDGSQRVQNHENEGDPLAFQL